MNTEHTQIPSNVKHIPLGAAISELPQPTGPKRPLRKGFHLSWHLKERAPEEKF